MSTSITTSPHSSVEKRVVVVAAGRDNLVEPLSSCLQERPPEAGRLYKNGFYNLLRGSNTLRFVKLCQLVVLRKWCCAFVVATVVSGREWSTEKRHSVNCYMIS